MELDLLKRSTGADVVDRAARQQHVADLVARAEYLRVAELSRALTVSEVTVRADLRDLAAAGKVRRVWGGARAVADAGAAVSPLAALAGALPRTGDTVLLAAGALSAAIAAALVQRTDLRDLTVLTGDLRSLDVLGEHVPRIRVRTLGGTLLDDHLRPDPHEVADHVGAPADLGFLGCSGIEDIDGDVVVRLPRAEDLPVASALLSVVRTPVLVAPPKALGDGGGVAWTSPAAFDTVITGSAEGRTARTVLAALRARGAPLIVAT